MKSKYKQQPEYNEKGVRYMMCQSGCCYISVGDKATAVRCSREVNAAIYKMFPEQNKPARVKTGRPAGWHWMAQFVDKDGTVYHKGIEVPELKGTLEPTTVKPTKKKATKRRTKEEILLAREAEKKEVLKKEFQKQKDLLSHKWGN
jgi:hypothetical protein